MKKFLVLIISLILALTACFAGCEVTQGTGAGGSSSTGSGSSSGNTPGSSDVPESAYTVTLVLPDGVTTMPDLTGIQAKWTSATNVYTADFNSSGFAYYDGLDGEYTVTITALPDGYTYNPNIYSADGTNKTTAIQLITLSDFDSGTGTAQFTDCANISATGAYRLTFTQKDQQIFILFNPNLVSTSYIYSFETLVDTTENEITPTLVFYYRWLATMVPKTDDKYDDIEQTYCGTFTKNLRFTKKYSAKESAGFMYVFTIDTIDEDYSESKYIDLLITRESEYDDTSSKVYKVEVESYSTDVTVPTGTMTWLSDICLSECGGDFSNFKLISNKSELDSTQSEGYICICYEDGFYYIYYNNAWRMIYTELTTCHYGSSGGGYDISYCFTDVSYYILWNQEDENGYPSYADVMSAYVSDSTLVDGTYHPVTPQMKTFLNYRAVETSNGPYFYDDTGLGILEEYYNLTSNHDNMWLFACGFYM